MTKRSIYNKNAQPLQNKKKKNINREIFNCLLHDRSHNPLSQRAIAEKIGCSTATVSRHIKPLINDKQPSGGQYYFIRWTFRGYIMAREDIDGNKDNENNLSNHREDLIYDLAQAKTCTMREISIITNTVVFCGVASKHVDNFDSAFRSVFSKDCYHTILHSDGGVYIILKEVTKKELQICQDKIAQFYKDIVKEMENIKCQKILTPTKTIEKPKK